MCAVCSDLIDNWETHTHVENNSNSNSNSNIQLNVNKKNPFDDIYMDLFEFENRQKTENLNYIVTSYGNSPSPNTFANIKESNKSNKSNKNSLNPNASLTNKPSSRGSQRSTSPIANKEITRKCICPWCVEITHHTLLKDVTVVCMYICVYRMHIVSFCF